MYMEDIKEITKEEFDKITSNDFIVYLRRPIPLGVGGSTNKIYDIVEPLLSENINKSSKDSSMAALSVKSLVAMGSSRIYDILPIIKQIEIPWFNSVIIRDIVELKEEWEKKQPPVSEKVIELLNNTINIMKGFESK